MALAIQDLAWAEHHRFVLSMLCYIPGELAVFGIGGCESDDAYTETLNSAWCVLAYRVLAWRPITVSLWLQERSPRMRRSGVMYDVGAVRLCPKGDPKGLGCSTPKGSERSITW